MELLTVWLSCKCNFFNIVPKVQIVLEGHKNWQNLHFRFDIYLIRWAFLETKLDGPKLFWACRSTEQKKAPVIDKKFTLMRFDIHHINFPKSNKLRSIC